MPHHSTLHCAENTDASPDVNQPDPWASYIANKTQTVHGSTTHSAQPASAPKFQQQEARLTQLEAAIQTVSEAQKKSQQTTERQFEHVHQQLTDTQQHFAKAMESAKTEIQQSVDKAMQAQSTQLNQNLAEIKALLLKPSKRNRESGGEDMEQD